MTVTLISGIVSLAIGVVGLVLSLSLPSASVGIEFAPKVFPAGLSVLMIVFSTVELAKEAHRVSHSRRAGQPREALHDPYLGKIVAASLFAVGYALLFRPVGYVISTILFLEAELWLYNGPRWKVNTLVAVIFSVLVYVIFSKLLGVYLPMTPVIWV